MPRYSIPRPDAIRLRHMLDAAREALEFVRGKTEDNIGEDRMLVLGLVKEIEIIGEAAGKVSEPTRRHLSQIPWQDVIDMRNRLIHVYFDIDVGVVWDTVSKDLRPLIAVLERALAHTRLSSLPHS
ncbi:MAG TPA: HepT-like ribonuclease domain-containing protein [bacterium]|nr:HepT-like ribonuclease domain-containing protein [bacterium]